MKDVRFIELLNLYIDQELSAEETGDLEREILHNPARRRIYEQYCRMHRGCALLFENARSQAPQQPKLDRAAQAAEEKVLRLPSTPVASVVRGPWGRVAWAGGAAAALAVAAFQGPAIMVAVRGPAADPVAASTALVQASPAVRTAPVARQSDYQLVALVNREAGRGLKLIPIAAPEPDWMQRLDFAPLQRVSADTLRFSSEDLEPDSRTFAGSRPFTASQAAVEFSAFQFQK